MIRHHDGRPDTAEKIKAQARRGAIWVVVWTPGKHRVFLMRKDAERAKTAWKKWYERCGWKITGFRATSPDGIVQHACVVQKYNPITLERIE